MLLFSPKIDLAAFYERRAYVSWKLLDGQVLLLDPTEPDLVRFNEVGSRIWQELDGTKSVAGILLKLAGEFDAPEKQIRKDALSFINKLSQMELIEKK